MRRRMGGPLPSAPAEGTPDFRRGLEAAARTVLGMRQDTDDPKEQQLILEIAENLAAHAGIELLSVAGPLP